MDSDRTTYLPDDLFNRIYARFHHDVERAVARWVPRGTGAQDVIWITWELSARRLVAFLDDTGQTDTGIAMTDNALRAWLCQTATFCARNHRRAEYRRDKNTAAKPREDCVVEHADAGDIAEHVLRLRCLELAIAELPPKLFRLVRDQLTGEMKPGEIALKYQLKPAAVRTRLAKARRTISNRVRELERQMR